jgi:uncharacterized protein YdhG (YjbR/CyaY superfamily)
LVFIRVHWALRLFKEIAGYKNAKGSVQFPLDKPMPVALITQMVKFKVAETCKRPK